MRLTVRLRQKRQKGVPRITNFKKRKDVNVRRENEKKNWSAKERGKRKRKRLQRKRLHGRKLRRKIVSAKMNIGTFPCSPNLHMNRLTDFYLGNEMKFWRSKGNASKR